MTCSNNFVELCKLQLHDAKLTSDSPLLFGTHSRNRKTCIDDVTHIDLYATHKDWPTETHSHAQKEI